MDVLLLILTAILLSGMIVVRLELICLVLCHVTFYTVFFNLGTAVQILLELVLTKK